MKISTKFYNCFKSLVEKYGSKTALNYKGKLLTYEELDAITDFLSYKIYKTCPKQFVGILIPNSLELIISILAIIKSGKAYVPLNINDPKERRDYIIADSGLESVLVTGKKANFNDSSGCIYINIMSILDTYTQEQSLKFTKDIQEVENQDLYMIYTSGTTGAPKGVVINEINLFSLLESVEEHYDFSFKDTWILCHNYAFDVSVWEIFACLYTGGTLIIPGTDEIKSVSTLHSLILENGVTVLNQTPGLFKNLLDYDLSQNNSLDTIRYIIFAGEKLNFSILDNWFKKYNDQARIYNMWGITEGTIHCSIFNVISKLVSCNRSIVGRPLSHLKFLLLNDYLEPVIDGTKGELFVCGDSIASGYLKKSELTKEKFIPYILDSGEEVTLYRTGDILRKIDNGEFEYLGRKDDQVKIMGYRIELGEIQNNIIELAEVEECVVKLFSQSIVAYVTIVQKLNHLNTEQLIQNKLLDRLPQYMIPTRVIEVEKWPLTRNGKINYNLLPDPFQTSGTGAVLQQNSIEKEIAVIWTKVLGQENICTTDDFFTLGGNSLLLMQLNMLLDKKFGVNTSIKDLNYFSTLSAQGKYIKGLPQYKSEETDKFVFKKVNENNDNKFPLSEIQQSYWLGSKDIFELGKVSAHTYFEYKFDELDVERLNKAWNILVSRHDALRTVILDENWQKTIDEAPEYSFDLFDTNDSLHSAEGKNHLEFIRNKLSHQMFDYSKWPIFEICVSRFSDTYIIHLSFDAIILDAYSLKILFKEWNTLYQEIEANLPEVDISLQDYMLHESELKLTRKYNTDKLYWLSRVNDLPEGPQIPILSDRTLSSNQEFFREFKAYSTGFKDKLSRILSKHNFSETAFFATVFSMVLNTWSSNNKFLINLTLFNRKPIHEDVNKLLGDFSSVMLLEINFEKLKNLSFIEKIGAVQLQLLNDLQHRSFSGIEVMRELTKRRSYSSSSVNFPIVYTSFLDNRDEHLDNALFAHEHYSITQTPQVWLDFKTYFRNNELIVEWDYVKELFPEKLVEDMHASFCRALEEFVENESLDDDYKFIPDYQLELIERVNSNKFTNKYSLLHEGVKKSIKKYSSNICLVHKKNELTYLDLKVKSQYISEIISSKNIQQNNIAIYFPKSFDQIISSYAVLDSNNSFVPIDYDLPLERVQSIISEGCIKHILCSEKDIERLSTKLECVSYILDDSIDQNELEELASPDYTDHELAYIIFTSGSTGKPKGVTISHAAAANTIEDVNNVYGINERDSVLGLSNLSFDLAIYDIFGLLGAGGKIILPEAQELKSPKHWFELIQKHQITVWNSVPMFMQMFVEWLEENIDSQKKIYFPRLILLSGDWVPADLPERIRKFTGDKTQIISLGGATEASIWSISYPIPTGFSLPYVPYGQAMGNQEMIVLDELGNYCPIGTKGEIYISGKGLALCYWKDKDKTFNSFIFHFAQNKKLYKTGDLGYLSEDGNIIFLGRNDNQVKINGYRVEFGDIENAINSHDKVSSSIVITNLDKTRLIAYVISKSSEKDFSGTDQINFDKIESKKNKKQIRSFRNNKGIVDVSKYNVLDPFKDFYIRKSHRNFIQDQNIDEDQIEKLFIAINDLYNVHDHVSVISENSFIESIIRSYLLIDDTEREFSKYRYASAGGLYPVQIYIKVGSEELDIPQGYYYYDPNGFFIKINSITNSSAENNSFTEVFFVADLDIIEPFYGKKNGLKYSQLEVGYMLGVLDQELSYSDSYTYSTIDVEDYKSFELQGNKKILEKIRFCKTGNVCSSGSILNSIEVVIFLNGLFFGVSKDGSLLKLTTDKNNVLSSSNLIKCSIFDASSLVIFFLEGEDKDKLDIGRISHLLQLQGVGSYIGFCPIGELDKESNTAVSNAFGKDLAHVMIGGKLNDERINSKQDSEFSELSFSNLEKEISNYIDTKLPKYMVPEKFIFLQKFPITPNGKVDRTALTQFLSKEEEYFQEPSNWTESQISYALEELLGNVKVSVSRNIFSYGMNSLLVLRLISRLKSIFQVDITIKEIFESPTVEEITKVLEGKKRQIIVKNIDKNRTAYPLTSAQQRLWFVSQASSNSKLFNVPFPIVIEGALDISVLEKSINCMLKKHKVLSCKLELSEKGLEQVFHDRQIQLEIVDIRNQNLSIEEIIEKDTEFDLSSDFLSRFIIFQTAESNYLLYSVFHHIIIDGWSLEIFTQDLSEAYNNLIANNSFSFANDHISYGNFALWHNDYLNSEKLINQREFWFKKLQDLPQVLELDKSIKRQEEFLYKGALYNFNGNLEEIKEFSKRLNVTMYVLLISVFKLLLFSRSNQEDVIVGSPVANRHYSGVEDMIGLFVNSVAVRSKIEPSESFLSFLEKVKRNVLDIQNNQDYPFDKIVKDLGIENS